MDGTYQNTQPHDYSSLGILQIDNLKVFGDISENGNASSSTRASSSSSRVNERLNGERNKAIELLQNSRKSVHSCVSLSGSQCYKENKENMNKLCKATPKLDKTDYVPFLLPLNRSSINISDLVTDETIHLEGSTNVAGSKVSFNPAEITGRSTHYTHGNPTQGGRARPSRPSSVSVEELLKSSMDPRLHKLADVKQTGSKALYERMRHELNSNASRNFSLASSASSTSFNQPNGTHQLLRTVDMSQGTAPSSYGGSCSFTNAGVAANDSAFNSEEFAPGELMKSQLLTDEIAWAEQFATIPGAALSKEAKAKAATVARASSFGNASLKSTGGGDGSSAADFSMGKFFQQRSNDIWEMVQSKSPEKSRKPYALVPTEGEESPNGSEVATPKIDNKTYSKPLPTMTLDGDTHESKDSGNSSHNSYLLSVSAIDRALGQLHSDESEQSVIEQMLAQRRRSQLPRITAGHSVLPDDGKQSSGSVLEDIASIVELIAENKENLDPTVMHSDTLSFTESLLNSTELKHLTRTSGDGNQPRSPLSPIAITVTAAVDNTLGSEADVDEWPSTPIKSPYRQTRKQQRESVPATREATPITHKQEAAGTLSNFGAATDRPSKTLSSTCLVGESVVIASEGNSPNESRICKSHNGGGASAASSPQASDCGTSRYGVPPMRSHSTTSAVARSTSRCSQSSEFSHRDGKLLPLKLTSVELSWGSTKLRANARKSLQLKNTADKRLVVRAAAHGPGFQLANMAQYSSISLQSQECRTITVNFCPTVSGVAVGRLSFYSPHGGATAIALLDIPLYGYGGHAVLVPQHIAIGPMGSVFLTMGDLQDCAIGQPLCRTFDIHNRGPLLGYAHIALDSSGLNMPRLCDAFIVEPQQLLIPPGVSATVTVTFQPKREELKKIARKIQTVLTLANMRIATGDEANRQRLRLHVQQMSASERDKLAPAALHALWNCFPNETAIAELSGAFARESPNVAYDLMGAVNVREIALTLNHNDNLDDTVDSSLCGGAFCYLDGDETVLFRTICVSPAITPPPALGPGSGLEAVDECYEECGVAVSSTTNNDANDSGWSVSPKALAFDFYAEQRRPGGNGKLTVRNNFRSRQYFEAVCTHEGLLRCTPSEGYVQPDGGEVTIVVDTLLPLPPPQLGANEAIAIVVSMENERLSVPVKIPRDNFIAVD